MRTTTSALLLRLPYCSLLLLLLVALNIPSSWALDWSSEAAASSAAASSSSPANDTPPPLSTEEHPRSLLPPMTREERSQLFQTARQHARAALDEMDEIALADAEAALALDDEADGEAADDEGEEDKNLTYDGAELVAWIRGNGGYIHPNARIGLDPTGNYRGVFVDGEGGIGDGELICKIPWNSIIHPRIYKPDKYWSCNAVHELHRQFQLGDDSPYAPYVRYLMDQPRGRLPNEWTPAGQDLLSEILGQHLHPRKFKNHYQKTWVDDCDGPDTELARAAYYQFTSRDEDTLMVPFYDMHNHSNDPKKLNTISTKPRGPGRPFTLEAIRDIEDGEQILISYNRCHSCWFDEEFEDCTTWSEYDTSDVFEVFGFTEFLPQNWSIRSSTHGENKREDDSGDEDDDTKFEGDGAFFCLEEEEDGLVVTFGNNFSKEKKEDVMPDDYDVAFLTEELERLRRLGAEKRKDHDGGGSVGMPGHEWDTTWTYYEAMVTAISAALLAVEEGYYENDYQLRGDGNGNKGDSDEL